jgi:hypothetical protein
MIAHDPRGTPEDARSLSAAVAQRVRRAIEARWLAVTDADVNRTTEAVAAALEDAAREAHDRHLRPEELVLAIKALENEVGATRGALAHADRRALRARLVTACIHAYFRAR